MRSRSRGSFTHARPFSPQDQYRSPRAPSMMDIQLIALISAPVGQPPAVVSGKYWMTIHTGRAPFTASWPMRVHSPTIARSLRPVGCTIG